MNTRPSLASGSRIGSYEILQKLGENALGEVFLVNHHLLHQQKVIKTIYPEQAFKTPEMQEYFFKNFAGAMELRHPNLVEISDIRQDDEQMICIVVEYMKNGTLFDYLTQHPEANTVSFVIDVAEKIASALAAIAQKGMIHGNINPSNIMLSETGEIKLADFGTVLPWRAGTRSKSRFTALEVFDGAEDIRSDIYSLGMSLYLLVAGRFPYHSEEFFQCIAAEGLPEPVTVCSTVPPALNRFIVRLTAQNPADRPQTVEELQNLIAGLAQELNAPVKTSVPKIALNVPGSKAQVVSVNIRRNASPPKAKIPANQAVNVFDSNSEKTLELSGNHPMTGSTMPNPVAPPSAPPSGSADLNGKTEEETIINEVAMRQQQQKQKFSIIQLPLLLYAFGKTLIAAVPSVFLILKDVLIRCVIFGVVVAYGGNYAVEYAQKIWDRENSASKARVKLESNPSPKAKVRLNAVLAKAGDWDALTRIDNPEICSACVNSLKNEKDPDALLIAATAMMMQMDDFHDEKEILALLEKAADGGSMEAMFFLRSWYESGDSDDEAKAKKYRQMCDEFIKKMKENQ